LGGGERKKVSYCPSRKKKAVYLESAGGNDGLACGGEFLMREKPLVFGKRAKTTNFKKRGI